MKLEREKYAKATAKALAKSIKNKIEEMATPEELAAIDKEIKENGPIKITLPFAK